MDQIKLKPGEIITAEEMAGVMREMLKRRSELTMEKIIAQAERSRIYQEEETGMKFPPAEMPD